MKLNLKSTFHATNMEMTDKLNQNYHKNVRPQDARAKLKKKNKFAQVTINKNMAMEYFCK